MIGAFGKRLTDVQQNNLKMGNCFFEKSALDRTAEHMVSYSHEKRDNGEKSFRGTHKESCRKVRGNAA